MKKLLIIPLLLLFVSCSDDPIEDAIEDSSFSSTAQNKKNTSEIADSNAVNKIINVDSASRYALLQYNKLKIYDYANQLIESILKKNKKLEFENTFGDVYGYFMTKETKDLLTYYGINEKDISFVDNNTGIYLSGRKPYINNGIFEKVDVNIRDIEAKYPHLYTKAIEAFYQKDKPQIYEIDVADKSGSTTDYCQKIRFSDNQEEYICFSVQQTNQRTIITLKRD